MADFNKAVKKVLEVEGGFVNHKNDRGGATNFGITIKTLKAWRKKPVTVADVKNMKVSEAKEIYKARYWDVMNLDKLPNQMLAEVLFDQGVNRGWKTAAKAMQKVLKVTRDGDIGPKTRAAMKKMGYTKAALAYVKDAQHNYVRIVKRKPSQMVFLAGWLNRSHKLLDMIYDDKKPSPSPVSKAPSKVATSSDNRNLKVLAVAASMIGVKEARGSKDNPQVVEFHKYSTKDNRKGMADSVPWCASFVCYGVEKAGMTSTNSKAARSFEKWGVSSLKNPLPGDIWIKYRKGRKSGFGHVGFVVKYTKDYTWVLGGNQNDEVNITRYSNKTMTDIRRSSKANYSAKDRAAIKAMGEAILAGKKVSLGGKVV